MLRFSRLASQARRPGEPCISSLGKLGTSRWAGGKPPYSRSSSPQFSGLAPKGAVRRALLLFSLTGRERCSLPDPPSNRRRPAGPAPPLVVGGRFMFVGGTRRQFSCLAPKGAARRASSSTSFLSCGLSVGVSLLEPMVTPLAWLPVDGGEEHSSSLHLPPGPAARLVAGPCRRRIFSKKICNDQGRPAGEPAGLAEGLRDWDPQGAVFWK